MLGHIHRTTKELGTISLFLGDKPQLFSLYHTDDYRAHTSCMTEAERYEGKLAKPKSQKRNPQQESWARMGTRASTRQPR